MQGLAGFQTRTASGGVCARFALGALLCCAVPQAGTALGPTAEESPSPADSPAEPVTGDAMQPDEAAAVDADVVTPAVSAGAEIRLEAARASVVQIRGFYGGSDSSAFHGTGFALGDGARIVTNFHVVADALLHPQQYRLEYSTADGRSGRLEVYAVDVSHDLAIVGADDLQLPPLRLRTRIPQPGERAYSIGFPLELGLTITEGVANGLVTVGLEKLIHYTGAINSGMSGGPALDSSGRVYGVNVSVFNNRQLIGFVIPAQYVEPLLTGAAEPLDRAHSARQARALVVAQVLKHEARIFADMTSVPGSQTTHGYTLPTRLSPIMECSTAVDREAPAQLGVELIRCALPPVLMLQPGLKVGGIRVEHRVLQSNALHPLQFARQLNRYAAAPRNSDTADHVAPFACEFSLVSLDGFDARVSSCVRQYRLYDDLFDVVTVVVSADDARQAIVSRLELQGVAFEPAMQVMSRYLGGMRWTP